MEKETSLEELFSEGNFKKRHPIAWWIDYKLFKNVSGIAGYAPHYAITHPHKILENWWYAIKWAWQRVFRGWDDTVIWSIDYYLAKNIPVWMRKLKEDKLGVPNEVFEDGDFDEETWDYKDGALERAEEKYNGILDAIADGFESYIRLDNLEFEGEEYEQHKAKFNKAMRLFAEYFGTFWD